MRLILKKFGLRRAVGILTLGMMLTALAFVYIVQILFFKTVSLEACIIAGFTVGIFSSVAGYHIMILLLRNNAMEEEIHMLATRDFLTQALSRRYFFDLAEEHFAIAKRYNKTFSIVLMDFDLFRVINKTYGHSVGDEILQIASRKCKDTIRESDLFGRYGGEEFIFLLPDSDRSSTMRFAERIRTVLSECSARCANALIHFTVSIGATSFGSDQPHKTFDSMIQCAEEALFAAKNSGRNRVVFTALKEMDRKP